MDISTTGIKVAEAALTSIDGALSNSPTGFSRILLAYAPTPIRQFLINGRIRLADLRRNEEFAEDAFKALMKLHRRLNDELIEDQQNPLLRAQISTVQKELRLFNTVIKATTHLQNITDEFTPIELGQSELDAQPLWWETFEELASRRNEDWRTELLAKAAALCDTNPNAVRLKALWEIGMLETENFHCLSLFCDSSIQIDGKPVMLIDTEEQNRLDVSSDENFSANLALVVSNLIDCGLIHYAVTQFSSKDLVELNHFSGPHFLKHKIIGVEDSTEKRIQIEGYVPVDYCLDICKLYAPKLNIGSDANFRHLKKLLEDSTKDDIESQLPETNIFEFS